MVSWADRKIDFRLYQVATVYEYEFVEHKFIVLKSLRDCRILFNKLLGESSRKKTCTNN